MMFGAGLGEIRHDAVHRLHHQVHVERRLAERPDRLAHHRPDGEVGHVVVVHHVEVHQVGAGAITARTSSPSRAKSADRMLGAMR